MTTQGCFLFLEGIATAKVEKRGVSIIATIMFDNSRIGYSYSSTLNEVREKRINTGGYTDFYKEHEEELAKVHVFRKLFFSREVQNEILRIRYEKAHCKIEK